MNKLTKGSIAAGAGLVLLLGGAGTFMSWNDNARSDGGTVTAGQLKVEASEGTWTVNDTTGVDIANYQIVPGDTVVYTVPMTVTADGAGLTAILKLGGGSITPKDGDDTGDSALARQIGDTAVLELTGAGDDGEGAYVIEEGITDVVTTATLQFPVSDENNVAMQGEVVLEGMNVNLTQNLGSGTETVE